MDLKVIGNVHEQANANFSIQQNQSSQLSLIDQAMTAMRLRDHGVSYSDEVAIKERLRPFL